MLLRGCPREVVGRIPALGWLVDGEHLAFICPLLEIKVNLEWTTTNKMQTNLWTQWRSCLSCYNCFNTTFISHQQPSGRPSEAPVLLPHPSTPSA